MIFRTDRRSSNIFQRNACRRSKRTLSVHVTSMPAWRSEFFSITIRDNKYIDVKRSDTISSTLGMNDERWDVLGEFVRKRLLELSKNYGIVCSDHEELMRVSILQGLDKKSYDFDSFSETDCIPDEQLLRLAESCINYILNNTIEDN